MLQEAKSVCLNTVEFLAAVVPTRYVGLITVGLSALSWHWLTSVNARR